MTTASGAIRRTTTMPGPTTGTSITSIISVTAMAGMRSHTGPPRSIAPAIRTLTTVSSLAEVIPHSVQAQFDTLNDIVWWDILSAPPTSSTPWRGTIPIVLVVAVILGPGASAGHTKTASARYQVVVGRRTETLRVCSDEIGAAEERESWAVHCDC